MTVTVPGPAGPKTRTRPAIEQPDTAPDPAERRGGRPRSAAAQRAYARRAQREGRPVERAEPAPAGSGGRARFVVLIISLLVVGI
ncbi:MAG TPA: hypothetical protein VFO68_00455, partial [Actinophytocola sp.]|nr:hypothetical protein [Actinophytocola sp.]